MAVVLKLSWSSAELWSHRNGYIFMFHHIRVGLHPGNHHHHRNLHLTLVVLVVERACDYQLWVSLVSSTRDCSHCEVGNVRTMRRPSGTRCTQPEPLSPPQLFKCESRGIYEWIPHIKRLVFSVVVRCGMCLCEIASRPPECSRFYFRNTDMESSPGSRWRLHFLKCWLSFLFPLFLQVNQGWASPHWSTLCSSRTCTPQNTLDLRIGSKRLSR